jgi:hypothetical protein
MHYVTRRSRWMQKHKFSILCPGALFVKSVPVHPKHEKWCVDVFLTETRRKIPYCTFSKINKNINTDLHIYRLWNQADMSFDRLDLALCLQSRKRSLKSFFHLANEICTPLKMRLFLWIQIHHAARTTTSI